MKAIQLSRETRLLLTREEAVRLIHRLTDQLFDLPNSEAADFVAQSEAGTWKVCLMLAKEPPKDLADTVVQLPREDKHPHQLAKEMAEMRRRIDGVDDPLGQISKAYGVHKTYVKNLLAAYDLLSPKLLYVGK